MLYKIQHQKLVKYDSISLGKPWPVRIGPAGIAIDEKRKLLYVVTREDKKLYLIDLKNKSILATFGLDAEAYDCKISPDHRELYISLWGADKLLVFSLASKRWTHFIPVGDNPNEILISSTGDLIYVCNANDNSVSIIDSKTKQVIETLDAALFPTSPSGSTSNSIALDPGGKKLYIANASKKRFDLIEDEIKKLEKEFSNLEEVWKSEKAQLQGSKHIKEEIEQIRLKIEEATRKGEWQKVSELQYGKLPELETQLKQAAKAETTKPQAKYRDWETDRKSTRLNSSHRL